jgi:hypothetical protein
MRTINRALRIAGLAAIVVIAGAAGTHAGADYYGRPVFGGRAEVARPEMHSFQPYSGLQFGFRPEPPGKHGIRPKPKPRPEVVTPKAVSPLIEYGAPDPRASQYYSY